MQVVIRVCNDPQVDELVKAALVIQYYMAGRGCNVYETTWSKKHPHKILLWSDIRFQMVNGNMTARIIIRGEKNAKRYTGSFQPIVLSEISQAVENPAPCPIAALMVAQRAAPPQPHATERVFPGVTSKKITRALNKHADEGNKHTAHAVRQGATSDHFSIGASDRELKMLGRWYSDQSINVYARRAPERMAEQATLVASMSATQARVDTAEPAPMSTGDVYEDSTNGILLLLAASSTATGGWRVYYYNGTTHQPATVESKEREEEQAHWDDIHEQDLEFFKRNAKPFGKQIKSDSVLSRDIDTLRNCALTDEPTSAMHMSLLPHRYPPAPDPNQPHTPQARSSRLTDRQRQLMKAASAAGDSPLRRQSATPSPQVAHPIARTPTGDRPTRTRRRPLRYTADDE